MIGFLHLGIRRRMWKAKRGKPKDKGKRFGIYAPLNLQRKEEIGKQRIKVKHFGFFTTWSSPRNVEGGKQKAESGM